MSDPSPLRQTLEGLRQQPDQLIEIILRQAAAIQAMQKQIEDLQQQTAQERAPGKSSPVYRPPAPNAENPSPNWSAKPLCSRQGAKHVRGRGRGEGGLGSCSVRPMSMFEGCRDQPFVNP